MFYCLKILQQIKPGHRLKESSVHVVKEEIFIEHKSEYLAHSNSFYAQKDHPYAGHHLQIHLVAFTTAFALIVKCLVGFDILYSYSSLCCCPSSFIRLVTLHIINGQSALFEYSLHKVNGQSRESSNWPS